MNKYDYELKELEKKFEEEKRILIEKSIKSELHKIPVKETAMAELLHEKLCNDNHIDYCDWYHDDGSWQRYSRKEYLEKARKILKITDVNFMKKILDIL